MMRTAILAGCVTVLAVTPALSQSKATIQSLDDKWAEAFNKGDAATVAAMYTEDAYVLPPGADYGQGRNAIEALWRKNMQQLADIKCTAIVQLLDYRLALGKRRHGGQDHDAACEDRDARHRRLPSLLCDITHNTTIISPRCRALSPIPAAKLTGLPIPQVEPL